MTLQLPVEPLAAVRVLDPRITINNEANKTYGVFTGPQQNSWTQWNSTSFSDSSIQIDMNPPSQKTYINRKIYIETQFELNFTGTSTAGNVLLQAPGLPTSDGTVPAGNVSYLNGPRAYPFAQICNNAQVTMGNMLISTNLNTYHRGLMRYMNLVDQRNLDLSMTPSMLDQHFEYFVPAGLQNQIQYSNRNPLGSYIANPNEEPRGSFVGCVVTSNTPTSATVIMTVVEPFWVSPFLYERGDEQTAFIGLNNMQLYFSLSARGGGNLINGLWSTAVDPTLSVITNATASVISAKAFVNYLTPQITQTIPETCFYSYFEPTNYITQSVASIASGASGQLIMNAVQLNSIPNRVYIFIAERDNDFNYTKTDTFLSIDSINVTFENQDGLLNNASQFDLYEMSVRNGCNMSFRQWSYDCGSVLCISFANDLALSDALLAPGARGVYNFSFKINVTNQTRNSVVPALNCIVVQEGVMSIENNNVVRSVGVLNRQEVLNVIESGHTVGYNPPKTVYGGLSWADIKNFFKSTLPKALRTGVNVAAKIVPEQYKPIVSFADQGLKLIGHGKRKPGRPRKRGGAMMSRRELEHLLG